MHQVSRQDHTAPMNKVELESKHYESQRTTFYHWRNATFGEATKLPKGRPVFVIKYHCRLHNCYIISDACIAACRLSSILILIYKWNIQNILVHELS